MGKLWNYIRNNPMYIVAWIFALPIFLYVLWEGVWVLVWLLGGVIVLLIWGARQNIKGNWK